MSRRRSIPCSGKQHGGGDSNLTTIFEVILDTEENVKNNNICFNIWRAV